MQEIRIPMSDCKDTKQDPESEKLKKEMRNILFDTICAKPDEQSEKIVELKDQIIEIYNLLLKKLELGKRLDNYEALGESDIVTKLQEFIGEINKWEQKQTTINVEKNIELMCAPVAEDTKDYTRRYQKDSLSGEKYFNKYAWFKINLYLKYLTCGKDILEDGSPNPNVLVCAEGSFDLKQSDNYKKIKDIIDSKK